MRLSCAVEYTPRHHPFDLARLHFFFRLSRSRGQQINQLTANTDFTSHNPSKRLRHRGSFGLGGSRGMRTHRKRIHHNWAKSRPRPEVCPARRAAHRERFFTKNKGLRMTKPLMMSGFRRQRKLDCSEDRWQKHGSPACIFVVREDLLPAWVPFVFFSRYPARPGLGEKSSSLCRIVQFLNYASASFHIFIPGNRQRPELSVSFRIPLLPGRLGLREAGSPTCPARLSGQAGNLARSLSILPATQPNFRHQETSKADQPKLASFGIFGVYI